MNLVLFLNVIHFFIVYNFFFIYLFFFLLFFATFLLLLFSYVQIICFVSVSNITTTLVWANKTIKKNRLFDRTTTHSLTHSTLNHLFMPNCKFSFWHFGESVIERRIRRICKRLVAKCTTKCQKQLKSKTIKNKCLSI